MVELNHKRIVVTFLMHLGDVLLTTPFLNVLRKAAPDSHITYVVDEKLKDVIEYNPNIDAVITVDKKGRHNSIKGLCEIAKKICEEKPDVVINLHPNERTSFLAWRIGAPITVGFSHFLFRPFMTKVTPLDRRHLHVAKMYVDVLTQLGVKNIEDNGLEMELSPEWNTAADDFYKAHGVLPADSIIGFNIGSAVPQKRWPAERFAQVADYFAEKGYKIIFFGGPMDIDMVQEAVRHMKHVPIIGTGEFSLGVLAAAMKRCMVIITNDSGPMHIAVSQKVPVVTLYGPSNPKFYGPYTDTAIILESMDVYEEGKSMKKIIKEGKYVGLSVIPTETVIQGVETLLAKGKNNEQLDTVGIEREQ